MQISGIQFADDQISDPGHESDEANSAYSQIKKESDGDEENGKDLSSAEGEKGKLPTPDKIGKTLEVNFQKLQNRYFMIVIDQYSNFPFVKMTTEKPDSSAVKIWLENTFSCLENPEAIIFKGLDKFEIDGDKIYKFLSEKGIKYFPVMDKYPRQNRGFIRFLEGKIKDLDQNDPPSTWDRVIEKILKIHRDTFRLRGGGEDGENSLTPAELMFGKSIRKRPKGLKFQKFQKHSDSRDRQKSAIKSVNRDVQSSADRSDRPGWQKKGSMRPGQNPTIQKGHEPKVQYKLINDEKVIPPPHISPNKRHDATANATYRAPGQRVPTTPRATSTRAAGTYQQPPHHAARLLRARTPTTAATTARALAIFSARATPAATTTTARTGTCRYNCER
jgi:hypothetical protein